ncbi:immunity 7 family protein [Paenibacillus sp. MDMC362]|uniref:immunity 7 family protein n=1 Tax=Paenibacillus sp. MDMC362 TaxID=2977365 RepID=UPI0021A78E5C|nr:immunity 7 family protein [Paenibacillus sp. MDMC362]
MDLRAVNGDYQVWIAGLNNHKPVTKHNPIEVLRKIGELAPGSYGVLYIRDDKAAKVLDIINPNT